MALLISRATVCTCKITANNIQLAYLADVMIYGVATCEYGYKMRKLDTFPRTTGSII